MPVFLSISLLLQTALGVHVVFEPDWSPAIPIDAFELEHGTEFSSIIVMLPIEDTEAETPRVTVETGSVVEEGLKMRQIIVRKTDNGTLRMFPVWYENDFVQMITRFTIIDGEQLTGQIAGFAGGRVGLAFWAEFLDYAPSFEYTIAGETVSAPQTARIKLNEEYYFVSFSYNGNEILETWFDGEGTALYLYTILLREGSKTQSVRIRAVGADFDGEMVFSYDWFGKKIGIRTASGEWKALYNDRGLRYLKRRFTKRVEEASGEEPPVETSEEEYAFICAPPHSGAGRPLRAQKMQGDVIEQYIYEYANDAAGNWTERDTYTLEEKFGALITVKIAHTKRVIEY